MPPARHLLDNVVLAPVEVLCCPVSTLVPGDLSDSLSLIHRSADLHAKLTASGEVFGTGPPLGADPIGSLDDFAIREVVFDELDGFATPTVASERGANLVPELQRLELFQYRG